MINTLARRAQANFLQDLVVMHPPRMNMKWRCYCLSSLLGEKFTYDFSTESPS